MTRAAPRWAEVGLYLAAAAIAYCLFRLALRPAMLAEARQIEDEVARMNAQASVSGAGSSGADGERAEELARELGHAEERVASLSGILATSAEAETVLRSLGATASAAGVRFVRFAPEPATRLDGYLAGTVSVVAEGTFFDFLRFFDRISLSPHLVLVEDVALESGVGDLLQCRFVAVTLRAAGAGAGSSNGGEITSTRTRPEEPLGQEGES